VLPNNGAQSAGGGPSSRRGRAKSVPMGAGPGLVGDRGVVLAAGELPMGNDYP